MSKTIIIGAGLIGSATAYALAHRGMDVILMDRAGGPATQASFANGGMLTPSMADPWNNPGVWKDLLRWYGRADAPLLIRNRALPDIWRWGLSFLAASSHSRHAIATALNIRLARYSLDIMRLWRDSANLSYDGQQAGTAKIYRDQAALERGRQKAAGLASFGIRYEVLGSDEIASRHPALRPISEHLAGAVFFPDDESGDAQKFSAELVREAAVCGAELHWNTNVRRICTEGGRVTGVELDEGGFVPAQSVVVAAGAWSSSLARRTGTRVAVKPVKGYSLTFCAAHISPEHRLDIPIVDDDLHAAVTPLGDRIRVAGTAELAGFDARPDPARLDNLRQMLRAILPDQADALQARQCDAWCNFRPMDANGIPSIGPGGVQGLFVNVGHGHLGWTQAAGSAEALARFMSGEPQEFDLTPHLPQPR